MAPSRKSGQATVVFRIHLNLCEEYSMVSANYTVYCVVDRLLMVKCELCGSWSVVDHLLSLKRNDDINSLPELACMGYYV